MSLIVLRPDNPRRVIPVKGHWGQDPGAGVPPDPTKAVALVPVAPYGYDSTSNLWLPQPVSGGGGGAQLENEYIMPPVDLTVFRGVPTEIFAPPPAPPNTPVAGRSLTIWTNNGTFNLYFTDALHNAIPVAALTYPSMITFVREFTHIFVDNIAQPLGAQALFYVGQRI